MSVSTLSLVSNSSMNIFPDNTSSHFVCKFPEELYYIDGDYEVAMTSFQCIKTWYTLREDEDYEIKLYAANANIEESVIEEGTEFQVELSSFTIKHGVYENSEDLIQAINNKINEIGLDHYFSFEYDNISKKISISFSDPEERWFKVSLTKDLTRKLGFLNFKCDQGWVSVYGQSGQTREGGYTVRLDEIDQIFVTCDLAQNLHVVGDIKSPLLHIVPSYGKFGDTIVFEPKTLIWLPIKRKSFDTAEIYITDAQGRNIPFSSGTSIVRVDIRRKNIFK